jgi:hypothetical protein
MDDMNGGCAGDAGYTKTDLARLAVSVAREIERVDDREGFRAEQKQGETDPEQRAECRRPASASQLYP